ncbi:15-hydroxyprostaglandin dehydrogenase [NAD(+)]-like [Ptychodera flava]|uniref:15-hydroxyprostaglandin dehydrogenase [NAD(+)]-like n=1 Tax=Ptychodera flava TaxID=63121 RepID=UPI00396A3620
MSVVDRVALITGGARGIGKAVGEELLRRGAKGVAIVDIDVDEGEATRDEFNSKYGSERAYFSKCDVASEEDLKATFQKTKAHFGRLDIVCNNALTYDDVNVSKFIEISLSAAIRGTYLAVEHIGKANGGNGGIVINTGSMAGLWPVPLIPCYCAAKAGVIHFTRSVADEPLLKQNGVRVNVLCLDNVDSGPHRYDAMKAGYRYGNLLVNITKERKAFELSEVADAFLRVIEDETLNGAVCTMIIDKGFEVMKFPPLPTDEPS